MMQAPVLDLAQQNGSTEVFESRMKCGKETWDTWDIWVAYRGICFESVGVEFVLNWQRFEKLQ